MPKIKGYEYNEGDKIGKGGYGTVYRGKDTKKGTEVAIKVIANYTLTKTQEREVNNLKVLNHENIVRLLDYEVEIFKNKYRNNLCYWTMDGNIYLIMEICEEDLDKQISNSGFKEDEIVVFISQTANGLAYIHGNGIVHRDIKPANILIKQGIYKITDFGLSKMIDCTDKMTSCGTEIFLAPEIRNSQPYNFKVDVWSLGITICCMISRSYKDLSYEDKPISKKLKSLISKMLKEDPAERIDSNQILLLIK